MGEHGPGSYLRINDEYTCIHEGGSLLGDIDIAEPGVVCFSCSLGKKQERDGMRWDGGERLYF